ncbi:hypothetical protein [Bdellovibrio sp. HCB2-146]|uniref:hypothetical protein n=1 Tax=Bdellovibrio sp. HCB2-146 TaxID=3394362 RepID=UPI0039BCADAE
MGFSDKKFEISMAALILVMLVGMGYVFKSPVQKMVNGEFTFEMPRPKAFFASLFDLGGREVSRTYINPFDKKKDDKPVAAADTKKAPPAPPAKAAQAKKAPEKKKDAEKKPSVEVNVVQNSPKEGLAGEGSAPADRSAKANGDSGPNQNTAAADAEKEKNKMAADQWRALLNAQPTKENVQKMAAAMTAGELDESSYLSIATDLIRSNNAQTQKLGVYALTFSYKAQAFGIASQYYDQLQPEAKTDAHAYLVSYATTGKLGILAGALQSSNAAVVEIAAQVVIEGYKKAQSNGGASDPRDSRGDVKSSGGVANYSQFVPIFQRLAQSSDSAIAQLAGSALSQIQVSVAAL